ncbi:MAG: sugar phosphate nucleotidyltransferase [Candidatus Hodarchaeota archaeon]
MSLLKNNNKENLSIVILCAGKGTRLKKIIKKIPKPLIKVGRLNDISILQQTINNLINCEITSIAIVIGYLGNVISEFISRLIKNHPRLRDKLIIIDTENQYKLGPLYSLLSITKNKNFFVKNKNYIIIPGDTIFDYKILKEIIRIISNNFSLIQKNPFIFYRNIVLRQLKEIYNKKKIISYAEIEIFQSEIILKRISQKRVGDIDSKKVVNQIIPIIVLNYDIIHEILNFEQKDQIETVWEVLNYITLNGKKVLCFEVNNELYFYDIDTKDDLKKQKKKEKDNRCSDYSKNN